MMTHSTNNLPEKPQDSMPCIEFGLRKEGEIDEKFSVILPDRYGRLCESHPFADYVDKAVATAITYAHNKKRRQGYFTSPFLVRYALVGRDGRRLYISNPQVMNALFPLPHLDHYTIMERGEITRHFHLTGAPYFTLMMRVRELPQRWADKIENIDIYVSPQSQPFGCNDANNTQETAEAESHFYRFASIDSRRFMQSTDYFNIPIASTYTPDIEAKEPLDEKQEIDEAAESRISRHSSPFIFYFLSELQASACIYPSFPTSIITFPILSSPRPCLSHASGLSPPLYMT